LLARPSREGAPQVGRSDGWPPKLLRELDRIPPTGRLTVTSRASRSGSFTTPRTGSVTGLQRAAYEDPCSEAVGLDRRQYDPGGSTLGPWRNFGGQKPLSNLGRAKLRAASPEGLAQWDLRCGAVAEVDDDARPRAVEVAVTICCGHLQAVSSRLPCIAAIVPSRCVHTNERNPPSGCRLRADGVPVEGERPMALLGSAVQVSSYSGPSLATRLSLANRSSRSVQERKPSRRHTAIFESQTVGFLCRADMDPVTVTPPRTSAPPLRPPLHRIRAGPSALLDRDLQGARGRRRRDQ
jgi:hypothetical protein